MSDTGSTIAVERKITVEKGSALLCKAQELDKLLADPDERMLSDFHLADEQSEYQLDDDADRHQPPINGFAVSRQGIGDRNNDNQTYKTSEVLHEGWWVDGARL